MRARLRNARANYTRQLWAFEGIGSCCDDLVVHG
jgi:predicted metalloprotease with PDZ domain